MEEALRQWREFVEEWSNELLVHCHKQLLGVDHLITHCAVLEIHIPVSLTTPGTALHTNTPGTALSPHCVSLESLYCIQHITSTTLPLAQQRALMSYNSDSCHEEPGIDEEGPAPGLDGIEKTQCNGRDESHLQSQALRLVFQEKQRGLRRGGSHGYKMPRWNVTSPAC